MKELDFPNRHYLNAAMGWLELGDPDQAKIEIDSLSTSGRYHPDALLMRWKIYGRKGQWQQSYDIARLFVRLVPDEPQSWVCLSYSLYRLDRPLEAWFQLLPKAKVFPNLSAIPYLLACYAAKAGSQKEADKWLARSAQLGGPTEITSSGIELSSLSGLDSAPRTVPHKGLLPSTTARQKTLWTV